MVLGSLGTACYGAGLADYEATCVDLGFKKRTPAFGQCVLELDRRATGDQKQVERHREDQQRRAQEQQQRERVQEQQRTAARGDGTPDHQTCSDFGFTAGTQPYSDCRMKISIAKQEAQQRQAAFELAQQRYQAEKQAYDAKVAEQKRQREVDGWLKASQFFFALGAGTSPHFSENAANAGRIVSGQAPIPPTRPQIQHFSITKHGQMTSCTVVGNNINCF